jgi:hypothetical protein
MSGRENSPVPARRRMRTLQRVKAVGPAAGGGLPKPDTAGSEIKARDAGTPMRSVPANQCQLDLRESAATEGTLSAQPHRARRHGGKRLGRHPQPKGTALRDKTGSDGHACRHRDLLPAPPKPRSRAIRPWSAVCNDRFQEMTTKSRSLLIHRQPNFVRDTRKQSAPRAGKVPFQLVRNSSTGLSGSHCVMSKGLGDVVGTGQAEKADGEVAEGGHDTGPFPVRTWQWSSSKVTSRTQRRRFSTHQWPRIQATSRALVPCAAVSLVTAKAAATRLHGIDNNLDQSDGTCVGSP